MQRRWGCTIAVLIVGLFIGGLFLQAGAEAHVPIECSGNCGLDTAVHIDEPEKSWAVYTEIKNAGEARYFEVHLEQGDRLKLSLFTPDKGEFAPSIVVMTPGGIGNATLPAFVEVPQGYGTELASGSRKAKAEYEPFTPSSYFQLAEYDREVTDAGDYYIAVFEPSNRTGKVGLAVGFEESFTVWEWLKVPWDTVSIHIWEGQNALVVLLPMLLTLAAGMSWLMLRHLNMDSPDTIYGWVGSIGGLLVFGSAPMTLFQIYAALTKADFTYTIGLSLFFFMVSALLGAYIIKYSLGDYVMTGERAKLLVLGILALVSWGGLIIGPIIVFIGAFMPMSMPSGKDIYVEEQLPEEGEGAPQEPDELAEPEEGKISEEPAEPDALEPAEEGPAERIEDEPEEPAGPDEQEEPKPPAQEPDEGSEEVP